MAAAYIIAAGGIIQLASAAFPAWELPNWTLRVLIVCLLMGFPVALMLAWAFDITADGIQATPDVAAPRTHRRRNVFMLVATGVIMSASAGFFLLPRVSAHKCDKSIAVLPCRIGNRVRVNVQLINAETDEHMWAEDYDRDLTDVFAIQTDLAQQIVRELQAKLSPSEKAQIERKPTENGEAYLAFVQAHNLSHAIESLEKLKQSEQLYQRAIDLDPKFALAIARYSQLQSWFLNDVERTPERVEKARTLAEQAMQLQPDLPEAHLALGFSYYYGDKNYEAALREFEIARLGLPNESEVYLAIGAIQRRQGKWAHSIANMEKAASLNPKDTWALQNLTYNYSILRNYDAANKTVDRALALDPTAMELLGVKSSLAIAEKGDFGVAETGFEALESIPMTNEQKLRTADARADVFLLERRYSDGLREAESLSDDQAASYPTGLWSKYYHIGFARRALEDESGARAAFLKAKSAAEEQLKRTPDVAKLRIHCAGPESKPNLGLVTKRSAFSGFNRQGRRKFSVEPALVWINRS
ncbi:MAG: hypothetical protein DME58_11465 [Verrucomicrobia bacterium]|nr:MAG: hypothetical protein DME58_11465 [Verrucomicrobiota bacterium]